MGDVGGIPAGDPEEEREYGAGLLWDDEEEEQEDRESRLELLCFAVGEEQYALNVFEVREIIKYQPVTVIPRCPQYILGVISVRGEIIPVIDLKRRLRLSGSTPTDETMIIIVHRGEEPVGVLVDSVRGIVIKRENEVETTPEVVSPEMTEFFKGVIQLGDGLATVLNITELLDVHGDFKAPGR
jgi:purine-binding chemotaxis protein CheW